MCVYRYVYTHIMFTSIALRVKTNFRARKYTVCITKCYFQILFRIAMHLLLEKIKRKAIYTTALAVNFVFSSLAHLMSLTYLRLAKVRQLLQETSRPLLREASHAAFLWAHLVYWTGRDKPEYWKYFAMSGNQLNTVLLLPLLLFK